MPLVIGGDQPAAVRWWRGDAAGVRGHELGRHEHLLAGRPPGGGQPAQRPVGVRPRGQHEGQRVGHPVGAPLAHQLGVGGGARFHVEQCVVEQHLLGQLAPGADRGRTGGRPVPDAVAGSRAVVRPPDGGGHGHPGAVVRAQVELGGPACGQGGAVGGGRVGHAPTVPVTPHHRRTARPDVWGRSLTRPGDLSALRYVRRRAGHGRSGRRSSTRPTDRSPGRPRLHREAE